MPAADDYPALTPEHLVDARLYADRQDMIRHLGLRPGCRVVEVGVALGDFSDFLLRELQPSEFAAIDVFAMHDWPVHWGRTSEEIFGERTHEQFYRDRFREAPCQIEVLSGLSHEMIPQLSDHHYDLIYIDAEHTYDEVLRDGRLSEAKVRDDGLLVFNDYTLYDHLLEVPYGVVPAVNVIVAGGEWVVVGFALNHGMFCDIALRRRGDSASTERKRFGLRRNR